MNIDMPILPSPIPIQPRMDTATTKKHTPLRRSARLTPSKKQADCLKPTNCEVACIGTDPLSKEPNVVKPPTARKLVLFKNTRGAVKERKNSKSAQMSMFELMVEGSLPRAIIVNHDMRTFGCTVRGSRLDREICREVIEFAEVSNSVIEIWMK